MNYTLTLNKHNKIALFYDSALPFAPEWASIDIELGQICLGGGEDEQHFITLQQNDGDIYTRTEHNSELLLIRVTQDKKRTPIKTLRVPFKYFAPNIDKFEKLNILLRVLIYHIYNNSNKVSA